MNHDSSSAWTQSLHEDPLVATTGDDDFSNFDFLNFDGLQDGQSGLDTPMGDLGMDQLAMAGHMNNETTMDMQHNTMAHHSISMAPMYGNMKNADSMDPALHAHMMQQHHAHMSQNHNYQSQIMMPLTPCSSEMRGAAARYQQHMDVQHGPIHYDRGQISFTPLCSPAFSIPEYTVPHEYFSPLNSPSLEPQYSRQQSTYPSAPSSETGATGSPIDLNVDPSKTMTASASLARRSGRKPSISSRGQSRSAKQSPLVKSQSRRKQNASTGSASIARVASSSELAGKDTRSGSTKHKPHGSSNGSGQDSVSPEHLSEILMPPPSIPRSAGISPNLQAQTKSSGGADEPATPATLMRLEKSRFPGTPNRIAFTPAAEGDEYMEDMMLPDAVTSTKPILAIDTSKANDDDQSTPTISAKTPKLMAGSTPRTTIMSPEILSPRATTPQKHSESKPGSRSSKKRQSTSSAQISPMLVPKISPSIKPLMPSSGPGVQTISADASALYLASKSNYQNILEGTHLPGVSYPEALAENLSSKRTSHKIAEQGRRNRINTALKEIEALLPPTPLVNGKKERTSSNDGDDGERSNSVGQGNSKASTVELAIVYIRTLQKDLADTKAKLEIAEKKIAEGNSSSSQTSD